MGFRGSLGELATATAPASPYRTQLACFTIRTSAEREGHWRHQSARLLYECKPYTCLA